METTVTTVANVNKVDIQIISNGEKRVAVKPICEALGIAYQSQIERLKNDPIIGPTITMIVTVGADNRQREMVTIPFEFVFGWLFLIDSRKVNPEARESVLRYQKECYHALYSYFTRLEAYLKRRDQLMAASFEKQEQARYNFSQAKNVLDEAKSEFHKAFTYSEADYLAETAQLQMEFSDGKEEEV